MRLTLWVPGLLLPDEIRADTLFDLAAPALSRLLGHARREALAPDWLAEAFGVPSPLPVAALRKLGAGEAAVSDSEWICIDPVHWQVSREGITLADPERLALDDSEAIALIAAIQPLFAEWGCISVSAPAHWEMRLARPLALDTLSLSEAAGQRVDPRLPAGLDGPAWRRLLAEAQTVLHAHPVNRIREEQGRPTINSLWPWGKGMLPQPTRSEFVAAWSTDPMIAGLCVLAGIPRSAPPAIFATGSGNVLCRIDTLAAPARALDALDWRAALLALEEHWIAPALAALRQRQCAELRLVGTRLTGTMATGSFSITRGDLWRFWRQSQPLTALTGLA